MKGRRGMLLAILLYFSVDLSAPEMPGAFMFVADDSVEISMTNASETKLEMSVVPVLMRDSFVVSQLPVDRRGHQRVPIRDGLVGRPMRSQLPRATLDSPSPSEDPH